MASPSTTFISDLHLDPSRPEIIDLSSQFIAAQKEQDALYILGDLFEYWIGDDQPTVGFEPFLSALKGLTDHGVPVFFIAGNRDFLIGKGFAEQTGIQLLPESDVIDLYGRRALIMHGDTLCTDDEGYQQLRLTLRNEQWQQNFLSLPLDERIAQALALREQSKSETSDKDEQIMDVNQQMVESVMDQHQVELLIHGHTHRPAIHNLQLNGASAQRIVLGDWYEQGSVLTVSQAEMLLFSVN